MDKYLYHVNSITRNVGGGSLGARAKRRFTPTMPFVTPFITP